MIASMIYLTEKNTVPNIVAGKLHEASGSESMFKFSVSLYNVCRNMYTYISCLLNYETTSSILTVGTSFDNV